MTAPAITPNIIFIITIPIPYLMYLPNNIKAIITMPTAITTISSMYATVIICSMVMPIPHHPCLFIC